MDARASRTQDLGAQKVLQGWTSEASIEPSYAFFPVRERARAIEHVSTRVFVPVCARESVQTWALWWDTAGFSR